MAGISPVVPKWKVLFTTLVIVVSKYQFPFDGRNTPTSRTPFPSQSPVTGISPVVPKWKVRVTAPVRVASRYQFPLEFRNTPVLFVRPLVVTVIVLPGEVEMLLAFDAVRVTG